MPSPSCPSTASARPGNKTSLSELSRARVPPSLDPSPKAKTSIPFFHLHKKSSAAPDRLDPQPSPTFPLPTTRAQPRRLTMARSPFSPCLVSDDTSSSGSRTPTPTSAITFPRSSESASSFSNSEPPQSNARTPTCVLRLSASDDGERRYPLARNLPPSKPAPKKSLPPPPTSYSTVYPTPTTPTTPSIAFPSPARSYTSVSPNARLPPSSVRKLAVSTSTAFRLTSGSESSTEPAQGYTGSSAAAGSKATYLPLPKSRCPPISLTRTSTSSPASRTSELIVQPPRSSSRKRASPPIQGKTSKSPTARLLPPPPPVNGNTWRPKDEGDKSKGPMWHATPPSFSTTPAPSAPPSVPPTAAEYFALKAENIRLREENAFLRVQCKAVRLATPKRTVADAGGVTDEVEHCLKRDEHHSLCASRRLSFSTTPEATGSGLDEDKLQGMLTDVGKLSTYKGDRARGQRIGLLGMDVVLDKLRGQH